MSQGITGSPKRQCISKTNQWWMRHYKTTENKCSTFKIQESLMHVFRQYWHGGYLRALAIHQAFRWQTWNIGQGTKRALNILPKYNVWCLRGYFTQLETMKWSELLRGTTKFLDSMGRLLCDLDSVAASCDDWTTRNWSVKRSEWCLLQRTSFFLKLRRQPNTFCLCNSWLPTFTA